jgi:predicted phosphodiesterase
MAFGALTSRLRSQPTSTPRPSIVDAFEPRPLYILLLRAPVRLLLYNFFRLINHLRSAPTPSEPPIRVVCISDTHTHIPSEEIPTGDLLIHAGDLTNAGSVAEIQKQIDWLCSLPHKVIVVISGNHDTYLDPRTRPSLSDGQRACEIDWRRLHYLQHRRLSLTITPEATEQPSDSRTHLLAGQQRSRRIRLYGAPQIPACGPMSVHAFQYPRGQDAWSETVPEDTDILITHTPPKYHLDLPLPEGLGCEHLLKEVKRVKPMLHVFGHVHWGAGQDVIWWGGCHDAYVNGMEIRSRWSLGLLNPRLWFNVVKVGYRGTRELIWDRVWGGKGPSTITVNAAQMHGNTGKLGNAVQFVDI